MRPPAEDGYRAGDDGDKCDDCAGGGERPRHEAGVEINAVDLPGKKIAGQAAIFLEPVVRAFLGPAPRVDELVAFPFRDEEAAAPCGIAGFQPVRGGLEEGVGEQKRREDEAEQLRDEDKGGGSARGAEAEAKGGGQGFAQGNGAEVEQANDLPNRNGCQCEREPPKRLGSAGALSVRADEINRPRNADEAHFHLNADGGDEDEQAKDGPGAIGDANRWRDERCAGVARWGALDFAEGAGYFFDAAPTVCGVGGEGFL